MTESQILQKNLKEIKFFPIVCQNLKALVIKLRPRRRPITNLSAELSGVKLCWNDWQLASENLIPIENYTGYNTTSDSTPSPAESGPPKSISPR